MGSKSRGRSGARPPSAVGSSAAGAATGIPGVAEPGPGPGPGVSRTPWPVGARVLISCALLYHMVAVLAGALGVPPSSQLEQAIAEWFTPYFDAMDLGYSYRFYAEPPPTPVVTATLRFGDGRPEETVRLPGRQVSGPRLRHQRQLALANALNADVREARERTGEASRSRLARAYARHLCRSRPGCLGVTLHVQQHLIPDPAEVRAARSRPGAPRFDLFSDRLLTTPEWIGDYSCDDF